MHLLLFLGSVIHIIYQTNILWLQYNNSSHCRLGAWTGHIHRISLCFHMTFPPLTTICSLAPAEFGSHFHHFTTYFFSGFRIWSWSRWTGKSSLRWTELSEVSYFHYLFPGCQTNFCALFWTCLLYSLPRSSFLCMRVFKYLQLKETLRSLYFSCWNSSRLNSTSFDLRLSIFGLYWRKSLH